MRASRLRMGEPDLVMAQVWLGERRKVKLSLEVTS
jgi:hypothetical protein